MNIDQLEHDLRAALATRADDVPAGASARVRAHDYRPRTRSVRPPVAAGALTAAAAAGAAVWLLALSADTPSAFAGWSATPTRGAANQVTGAEASCRQQLSARVAAPPPAGLSGAPAPVDVGHLEPALTDTRGPFTWVIFAGDHGSASCISGPSFTALSGSASTRPQTPSARRVALSSSSQTTTPDGHAYSFAEGRAGAGVTAVTLVLDDGTQVQTTVEGGWFVAWWPGNHTAASARVTTLAGTTTESLPVRARPAGGCPQPKAPSGKARMCMTNSSGATGAGSGRASGSVVTSSTGG